ncbi:hypothetical protein E2C01_034743 [Portunus trituberculatus]|uniref:Uncharacterized protein n=1 Tax=Portunus trituberculatus TaxID=210409 RepID=A0A5B7F7Q8_PORTR|nr:hypothetical protein [Portunus trituberculatus]
MQRTSPYSWRENFQGNHGKSESYPATETNAAGPLRLKTRSGADSGTFRRTSAGLPIDPPAGRGEQQATGFAWRGSRSSSHSIAVTCVLRSAVGDLRDL